MLPLNRFEPLRQNPPINCHGCSATFYTEDQYGKRRAATWDAQAAGWLGFSRLRDEILGQCPPCQKGEL